MTENIKGTCLDMCPEKERKMREREGLLHKFEIDERTKHMRRPKANPNKCVKCFARPAAGQVMSVLDQLRPGPVLLMTIRYLFTKVVTKTDVDWVQVYDFVFDRLRAIRQDIVIQRLDVNMTVQLLEPIVRFHVYAAQRLCERNISEYDPKINNQHLNQCIKHLLLLYDEQDKNRREPETLDIEFGMLGLESSRPQMEALYILLHLGDKDALERALTLPLDMKTTPDVSIATQISLNWCTRNYVYVFDLIKTLTPLLLCSVMINLRSFRRDVLQIMSWGYSNPKFTFPGRKLQELLLYRDVEKLKADCQLFGLKIIQDNVLFEKAQFKKDVLLANPEMYYNVKTLHRFVPQILLVPEKCNS